MYVEILSILYTKLRFIIKIPWLWPIITKLLIHSWVRAQAAVTILHIQKVAEEIFIIIGQKEGSLSCVLFYIPLCGICFSWSCYDLFIS